MEFRQSDILVDVSFLHSEKEYYPGHGLNSGKSNLICIFGGDLAATEDGRIRVPLALAQRDGYIRSHTNLIEKVFGVGERKGLVSLPQELAFGKMACRGWVDHIRSGEFTVKQDGITLMPRGLNRPETDQDIDIIRRIGVAALYCLDMSVQALREDPCVRLSSEELDKRVILFKNYVMIDKKRGES